MTLEELAEVEKKLAFAIAPAHIFYEREYMETCQELYERKCELERLIADKRTGS